MNLIIDPIVGVAVSAPFYVFVFLIIIFKAKVYQNITISKVISFVIKSIILFMISGLIAYIPYYFGFDFYYYGRSCKARGSITDCPYGYFFKADIISGLVLGALVLVPFYWFVWFFLDVFLLFKESFIAFLSFFKRNRNAIGSGIKYKKYKGDEYSKFKDHFMNKDK